eukprot:6202177-Pleurochrysis_carterae.AAC.1
MSTIEECRILQVQYAQCNALNTSLDLVVRAAEACDYLVGAAYAKGFTRRFKGVSGVLGRQSITHLVVFDICVGPRWCATSFTWPLSITRKGQFAGCDPTYTVTHSCWLALPEARPSHEENGERRRAQGLPRRRCSI